MRAADLSPLPALLTVTQASELLSIPRRTFYSLAARGAIPSEVLIRSGRKMWVLRGQLERWAGLNEAALADHDGKREAPGA